MQTKQVLFVSGCLSNSAYSDICADTECWYLVKEKILQQKISITWTNGEYHKLCHPRLEGSAACYGFLAGTPEKLKQQLLTTANYTLIHEGKFNLLLAHLKYTEL